MATGSSPSGSVNLLLAALQHLSKHNAELQEANSELAAKLAAHQQTEATLRDNEARFRLLAEASNDALFDWDLQTNAAWSNDGFQRLFGPTPPPGDMNWWWERIHPEDRQRVQDDWPLPLENNRAVMTLECRLRCQDGTYADMVSHWRIVRDADGQALRVVGAMTDITERKQAERALRESEQNVRHFQEQLRTLHEVGIELDSAESAVELGRSRLGFDRLGIWLYVDNSRIAQGSFGTDEHGQTRDERSLRIPVNEYGIKRDELARQPAGEVCGPILPLVRGEQHIIQQDPANILATSCDVILGTGWSAQAAMWDGRRPIGHISADNLIQQRPLAPYQLDLLALYGTTLGHLYTRKLAERALRESEQNAQRFQEQLRTLHEVGIELDSADSLDELCRRAVELGRSRLGFDRLGIWLYQDDNQFLQGTFGTDEYGQTLDERNFRLPATRHKGAAWVLTAFERWQQSNASEPFNLVTPIIVHERDSAWTAQAAMWDGKRPIGHISADNLIQQRPIAPYQMDLLSLYGVTLGHVYTRKQAERAVRQSEAHLRAVLDSAPLIVFAANRQGTLTLNAGQALSQIGVRPGQNVGQSALDLFGTLTILESPDRVTSVAEVFSRVLGGETVAGIGQFGQSVFDAHYTPLLDARGQVQGLVGVAVDITERKRAEEALRLSEKRYSVISGLSSDYAFSCIVLPNGTLKTEWLTDEAYQRITGYHPTEIGTAFTLYHPDDAPLAEQHVRQVLAGHAVDSEYRILTKSGDLKWMRIIRDPEWDEAHQRVVRYYGAVEDITERKRSEEALRLREAAEREQRILADALRNTAAALTSTLDPEVVMVRILENVVHVVPHDRANILLIEGDTARLAYSRGWSAEEAAALKGLRLPLTAPGVRDILSTNAPSFIPDTLAYPGWINFSPHIRSYASAPIRLHGQIIGFLDLLGQTPNFFSALHAERLQAFADQAAVAIENAQLYDRLRRHAEDLERRVAERTHDLQVVVEVSRQITTVLDIDKLLADLGERILNDFDLYDVSIFLVEATTYGLRYQGGASRAERRTGAGDRNAIPASQTPIARAAQSGEPVWVMVLPQSADFSVDRAMPPIRSELALPMMVGQRLLGVLDLRSATVERFTPENVPILTNLAEQIGIAVRNAQLFAELEVARRDAQAAQKAAEEANQVKSQFLANMSHELRTPLNALLNFAAFVADGVFGPINADQAEALTQASTSGKHLLSLINDILDITKIEVGQMDLFIQEVDFNEALAATISLTRGLIKDKPLELITNIEEGLPHTFGDRRRIRQVFLNLVSNAVKFTPHGTIGIMAHRERDAIHVAVSDTGIGIAPEDQALIFDSFKQAQNDLPETVGTGLGLALSEFFAEAHGGTIWLESKVGKGSTFHVMLPIRTEAQARQVRPTA